MTAILIVVWAAFIILLYISDNDMARKTLGVVVFLMGVAMLISVLWMAWEYLP